MTGWRELASILAREAAYRAARRAGVGQRSWRWVFYGAGNLIKSNAVVGLLLSAASVFLGWTSAVEGDLSFLTVSMGLMGFMEFFMAAFGMTMAVHTVMAEDLLTPLRHLPVGEGVIRRALLAVGVYWGLAAAVMAVIPGSCVAAWMLGLPSLAAWGLLEAASLAALASGIGYLIGSLTPKYTRSRIARAIQTVLWISFFLAGFVPSVVGSVGGTAGGEAGGPGAAPWVAEIPPFCYAAAALGDPAAAASALATSAAAALTFLLGSSRLWRAASLGSYLLPSQPPPSAGWAVRAGSAQRIIKDLRLLARNPRILASTVYTAAIPILIVAPTALAVGGWVDPTWLRVLTPAVPAAALFLGGIGGLGVTNLFVVEGEGARLLYVLPLTKAELAREKAALMALLNVPAAAALAAACAALGDPASAAAAGASYELAAAGSALLNAGFAAGRLPEQPSTWSQQTFSGLTIVLAFLGEILMFGLMASLAVAPYLLYAAKAAGFVRFLPAAWWVDAAAAIPPAAPALVESAALAAAGWAYAGGKRGVL